MFSVDSCQFTSGPPLPGVQPEESSWKSPAGIVQPEESSQRSLARRVQPEESSQKSPAGIVQPEESAYDQEVVCEFAVAGDVKRSADGSITTS